ncbi:MAG TPA: hypothetical protein PLV27_00520 [Anaerolineaceae bacterium]|nr:hypothetical protein [Anaerolineaceae bacterium]
MTITYTQISFDNEGCKQLLQSFLESTNIELAFETQYGCGITPNVSPPPAFDWENARLELLNDRKALWEELSKL